jgi:hypothetical protein
VPYTATGGIARIHALEQVETEAAQICNGHDLNGALSAGIGLGDPDGRKPFGDFALECRP